jgi:hypothetical protein
MCNSMARRTVECESNSTNNEKYKTNQAAPLILTTDAGQPFTPELQGQFLSPNA